MKLQPHKMVNHIQTIRRLLAMNCLSVFDHFIGLAFKGLNTLPGFSATGILQKYNFFIRTSKNLMRLIFLLFVKIFIPKFFFYFIFIFCETFVHLNTQLAFTCSKLRIETLE